MSQERNLEEHVLLKQIHFLTDLINNAKRPDIKPSTSGNNEHSQERWHQRSYDRNRHGKIKHSSQKNQAPHQSWHTKLPKTAETRKYTWNKHANIQDGVSKPGNGLTSDKRTQKEETCTQAPVVKVITNHEEKKSIAQSLKGDNSASPQKRTAGVPKYNKDVETQHVHSLGVQSVSEHNIQAAFSSNKKSADFTVASCNADSKSLELRNQNPVITNDKVHDGFLKSRSLSPEVLSKQTSTSCSNSKIPVLPSFVVNKSLNDQVTGSLASSSTSSYLNKAKISTKETLPSSQTVTTSTQDSKDVRAKSIPVKPSFFLNKKGSSLENHGRPTSRPIDDGTDKNMIASPTSMPTNVKKEVKSSEVSMNILSDIESTTTTSPRKEDSKMESPSKRPDITKLSVAGTEREAVKSQLNTQLAEAAAKLEQLKRNLTNRKVTMESLGAINMVKHRTNSVKSTKNQKKCHDSKVSSFRQVPVSYKAVKATECKSDHEKNLHKVIFDPKFSMTKKSETVTSLPQNQKQLKVQRLQKGHNFHSTSHPPCKAGKQRQVIFDPKYKLRKSSLGSSESITSITRNKRLIVNTIKSKYKLIKTATGQMSNISSPYNVKNIVSKHGMMKGRSPTASFSQSKYRSVSKSPSNHKVHKFTSRYKLRKTLPHGATASYLRSNLSDVPSLQAKHFQYTSQGQLIYTPQGIRKYHSFPSYGLKKSATHYKTSKHMLHHRGYHSFVTRYKYQPHYSPVQRQAKYRATHQHLPRKSKLPTSGLRSKFIFLNGSLYKSSSKSLIRTSPVKSVSTSSHTGAFSQNSSNVITVRGVKFHMDVSGKTLTRMTAGPTRQLTNKPDRGSLTYIRTGQGHNERSGNIKTRVFASRAVIKSRATVMAKFKKDNTKHKYCLFYNRFGKCRRGDKCPYIHDPEKVAVCTRFLRGTCQVKGCPFSHKLQKEKMPVCSYFLRGVCIRDDCPYLHVNVGKKASVCPDFLKGFCPLGAKCKKRHVHKCPAFSRTGHCPDGENCPLTHKRQTRPHKVSTKRNVPSALPDLGEEDEDDDVTVPFKKRKLQAYISVSGADKETEKQESHTQETSGESIQIRPKLV